MKEKTNLDVVEDKKMRKWRGLSQSEIDLCWKNLVERVNKYKVEDSKREAFRGRGALLGMEEGAQKQEIQNKKVVRRLLGKNFSLFGENNLQRLQSKQEESTEGVGDEAAAKNGCLIKNIRSKGRMDAKNRGWVAEILATDCEKAWIHTELEDALQKWHHWLEEG